MLYREQKFLLWQPYKEHKHTRGKMYNFLLLQEVVYGYRWILKGYVEFGSLASGNGYSTSVNLEPFSSSSSLLGSR
jgi:hypothetical protein